MRKLLSQANESSSQGPVFPDYQLAYSAKAKSATTELRAVLSDIDLWKLETYGQFDSEIVNSTIEQFLGVIHSDAQIMDDFPFQIGKAIFSRFEHCQISQLNVHYLEDLVSFMATNHRKMGADDVVYFLRGCEQLSQIESLAEAVEELALSLEDLLLFYEHNISEVDKTASVSLLGNIAKVLGNPPNPTVHNT
jgi:hypothetical protein